MVFKKSRKKKNNLLSIGFKVGKSEFLLPVEKVGNSSRFPSVAGGDPRYVSLPCSELRCALL